MFEFQLVITEKCNLHCNYCYIQNKKSEMDFQTFDVHLQRLPAFLTLFRKQDYNACFFGGEPLLNYDLIKYALPKLSKDPKCKNIVLPTNGILLNRERVDFLRQYNVNISWSFDGIWAPGEITPEKVSEIRKLLDPLYSCKVMMAPNNKGSLVENYRWFVNDLNVPNPDFSIVRDDIWSDEDVKRYEHEIVDFANQVIKYFKGGKNIAIPAPFSLYILDTILGKKKGKRPFGCFAGLQGAAFMPDGRLYPCARFGSLNECEIDSYFSNLQWSNKHKNVIEYCKDCELYQYCNAGCTWSQLHNGNRPIKNVCRLLKATYKEAFRIVDVLKDNENFKNVFRNMIKETNQ